MPTPSIQPRPASIRARTNDKLLDAAEALFFTQGIAATPIDAVLARAGVSAASLYRGYPSKEALVAAALARRQGVWIQTWEAAIAEATTDEDRLLAVFTAHDRFRANQAGARWCAFLGSAAEYAHPPVELADAVRLDSRELRRRLTELAVPLAHAEAARLAEELVLVVSGALAMRLREEGPDPTATARHVAVALLAAFAADRPAGERTD